MSAYGDDGQDPVPGAKSRTKRVLPTRDQTDALRAEGVQVYGRADMRSHGVLSIGAAAVQSFMQKRALGAAASVTYYALMSLFPLMVFALTLMGGIFGEARVAALMVAGVDAIMPVGREFFHSFLAQTASAPTSIQLFSLVVLLWSASSLYVQLIRHVEEAWQPLGARINSLRDRRLGIFSVGLMVLLVGAVVLASMVVSMVPHIFGLIIPGLDDMLGTVLAPLLPRLLQPLLIFVLLFGLYMLAPSVKVWPVAAAWAAGLVALVWPIVYWGFGWWMSGSVSHYQHLYGSLATVITLLLWMYTSALIVLAGAHLCAAIQWHHRLSHQPDSGGGDSVPG